MAMTPQLRRDLITRLLAKAAAGQLDVEAFVADLVAALGDRFDTRLGEELAVFRAQLTAARDNAVAQASEVDAKLGDLPDLPSLPDL